MSSSDPLLSSDSTWAFIAIGSELLKGVCEDENGPWLARFLQSKGHRLIHIGLCEDNEKAILKALDEALARADIVVLSGGLGPTPDDLTEGVLSPYVEGPTEHLPNPVGKAYGLLGRREGRTLAALPGVPVEFRKMFEAELYPRLFPKGTSSDSSRLTVKTWGIGEEKLWNENPRLWDDLAAFGSVSSLPWALGVDIGVDLRGSLEERKEKEQNILDILAKGHLKDRIWQVGELDLSHYVFKLLEKRSLSLGFCESCTGGLASHHLTDIPGSSKVFKGSVVCYANDIKSRVLGLSEKILKDHGAVSEETARALAQGGQKLLGVDYCLAYTGIAGPGGGSPEKPVGTVGIALQGPRDDVSGLFHFSGSRTGLKEKFWAQGLLMLARTLQG
ncbi:MAG: nicotinamide-nucleotide amidohydrolase family protein [Bacteriovoracales bacterium]|nr:nicotinamide-nucleotide amidohydrolase family protein [Bacteriovoracales bacterium]